jgi:threonine aldolase
MSNSQQFASDNYSGICPEAWAAMSEANRGHAPAYGDDIWTAKAADAFRNLFETPCEVFFAFNGTAASSRWRRSASPITVSSAPILHM